MVALNDLLSPIIGARPWSADHARRADPALAADLRRSRRAAHRLRHRAPPGRGRPVRDLRGDHRGRRRQGAAFARGRAHGGVPRGAARSRRHRAVHNAGTGAAERRLRPHLCRGDRADAPPALPVLGDGDRRAGRRRTRAAGWRTTASGRSTRRLSRRPSANSSSSSPQVIGSGPGATPGWNLDRLASQKHSSTAIRQHR